MYRSVRRASGDNIAQYKDTYIAQYDAVPVRAPHPTHKDTYIAQYKETHIAQYKETYIAQYKDTYIAQYDAV